MLNSWPLSIAPVHSRVGEGACLLRRKLIDWLRNACERNATERRKPLKSVLRGCRATICALIFVGFNVRGFHRSTAIHKYFVHKYLNVTVNGHVHSSSQLMTLCVTEMAISCNFAGYGPTLPQKEHTDARDPAQYMADRFSASLHCNSKRIFSVASFSNERRPYLLVDSLHSV